MTAFTKEDFTWDGMYLMYRGRLSLSAKLMEVASFSYMSPILARVSTSLPSSLVSNTDISRGKLGSTS